MGPELGNGQPQVKLFAKNMKQSADLSHAELENIELRIYQKDGLHYDRVNTALATFTTDNHKLYAPGDAHITLNVPVEGDPAHELTSITTSGINFDSTTGQAVTDKHVSFTSEWRRRLRGGGLRSRAASARSERQRDGQPARSGREQQADADSDRASLLG